MALDSAGGSTVLLLVKLMVLVGLVRLLDATDNPLLCASIYAGVIFVFSLAMGGGFLGTLLMVALRFLLALGFFSLMDRFESLSGAWWLLVGLGGLLVVLV